MSLDTSKFIHAYHWVDDLPIPDNVIERVEEFASGENMPLLQIGSAILKRAPGVYINDEDVTDEELQSANIEYEKIEAPTLEYK